MKVKILSGSQAGSIVEMDSVEAQNNIATGYAEAYIEPVAEASEAAEPARGRPPKSPKEGDAS